MKKRFKHALTRSGTEVEPPTMTPPPAAEEVIDVQDPQDQDGQIDPSLEDGTQIDPEWAANVMGVDPELDEWIAQQRAEQLACMSEANMDEKGPEA